MQHVPVLTSFLSMAGEYSTVWIDHSFSIHPLNWGCFYLLVMVNRAATNMHVMYLFRSLLLIILVKNLAMELLGHMVISFFRNHQTVFQKQRNHVSFYQQCMRVLISSWPTLAIFCFFFLNNNHHNFT